MFRRFHEKLKEHEEGFTLIELLVVILIIAILAAIAIPVFLRQREKGYVADAQSTLKNWATAVESAATSTDPPGDYSQLTATDIEDDEDAKVAGTQQIEYFYTDTATEKTFCLKVTESRLETGNDWYEAIYLSTTGAPKSDDDCTGGTAAGTVTGDDFTAPAAIGASE